MSSNVEYIMKNILHSTGQYNNKYVYSPISSAAQHHIYFMVEGRDIHNFTMTGNWTQVNPLRGGSKQLVSRRNNWSAVYIVKNVITR